MKTKSNNKTGIYLGSLLVCFVMSFAAHAQQAQDLKNIVMFDPLFWKEQLKLKDAQCRSIQDINAEYYENLRRANYKYFANHRLQQQYFCARLQATLPIYTVRHLYLDIHRS